MPFWLSLVAIILPFLTAIIIFIRKSYRDEALNLLMLLSLVIFAKNLLFALSAFEKTTSLFYVSLFEAAEFVLLVLIFRFNVQQSSYKEWMNYLLVGFLSVTITLHATQVTENYLSLIANTQAVLLCLLAIITLLILIRNQYIFIFHSSLFWIAGGTLFFSSMSLAAEVLSRNGWFEGRDEGERQLLLYAFNVVRLLFYLIAALIQQSKQQEEDWKYFKNSSQE